MKSTNTRLGSIFLSALLLATLGYTQTSEATVRRHAGQDCVSDNGASIRYVDYHSDGVSWDYSAGETEGYFWCPISGGSSSSIDYNGAQVYVYDGSGAESIACTIYAKRSTGTTYTSSTITSSAYKATQTLNWYGANLPNAGSALTFIIANSFYCRLPDAYGADDPSNIRGYYADF